MTDSASKPFHLPSGQGTVLNVMGSINTIKVSGSQSGGTITLMEIQGDAGTGVPLHTHAHEDESFYILEGEVEIEAEGKTILCRPGDTVWGPRGVPHSWLAKTPCRMLVAVTPSGMETMFEKLAALPQDSPSPRDILAICAEAGITFP